MQKTHLHHAVQFGFEAAFVLSTKRTTKNIRQQTFFLWLRRDVDELKLISDDKNYAEMQRLR